MSHRTSIQERIIAFLKVAGAATPLTDQQVIKWHPSAPRPALPYLQVRVSLSDLVIGHDEQVLSDGGAAVVHIHVRGQRQATASVQAFGETAVGWLERAELLRHDPDIIETTLSDPATGLGITLANIGGLQDLTGILDTSAEPRALREYRVLYGVTSSDEPQDHVEAATVEVSGTLESDSPPGDLAVTVTIST